MQKTKDFKWEFVSDLISDHDLSKKNLKTDQDAYGLCGKEAVHQALVNELQVAVFLGKPFVTELPP